MSKKKPQALTADNVPIKKGDSLYEIVTDDGGKTWSLNCLGSRKVVEVESERVTLAEQWSRMMWEHNDSRLYSTEEAAKAECRKRNRASKKNASDK